MGSKIASLGGEGRDLRPDSPEGIRITRTGSLAAEAGLSLGPVTEADIQQAPELAIVKAITKMNTTTPQAQQTVNTDSSSKALRREFALAEQAPPDHWI